MDDPQYDLPEHPVNNRNPGDHDRPVTESLRVLVLEDRVEDAQLMVHELRRVGYELTWQLAQTEQEFEVGLGWQPDVILADYALPQFDGLRALEIIRERGMDVPFILVSGVIGEELAVKVMKEGAADYVPKEKLSLLVQSIQRGLQSKQMREEKCKAEEALVRSEARLRALLENSSEMTFILDENGIVEYVTPAVERILGYKPHVLLRESAFDFIHPDDSPRLRALFSRNVFALDPSGSCEWRFRHQDASWRILEVHVCDLLGDPVIAGIVLNSFDITDRKRTEEELRYASTHDPLTGLFNRTFFAAELSRLQAGRQFPVSVIVADMDGLKIINDKQGHFAGDQALQRAASVIRSVFRSEDIIARIGGDEFAALLPLTDPWAANERLLKIRRALKDKHSFHNYGPLRLSLGAATAEWGQSIDEAFRCADASMYRDKSACMHTHGSKSTKGGWDRPRGRQT